MKTNSFLLILFLALPALAQPPVVEDLGQFRVDTELSTYIFPFNIGLSHDGNSGSFVVTWASYNTLPGMIADVLARRFDSLGQALGAEFLVNQETAQVQQNPSISHAPDGGFAVVWQDFNGGAIESLGIDAQRFDALGMLQGPNVAVDGVPNSQDRPSVSHAPDGSFLITWDEGGAIDGSGRGIRALRFDASGAAIGAELQVNLFTMGDQENPEVSYGPDGSSVIVWNGSASGVSSAVRARRLDASGTPFGLDLQVSTATYGTSRFADISHGTDGGFVIVWGGDGGPSGSNGIQARLFDSGGQPAGGPFRVDTAPGSPALPRVSHGPDGSFVMTWQVRDEVDPSDIDVRARLFSSLGLAIGDDFQVNADGTDEEAWPVVSHGLDGTFVVAWSDYQSFFGDTAIRARMYRADLTPVPVVEVPALGTVAGVALAVLLAALGAWRIR